MSYKIAHIRDSNWIGNNRIFQFSADSHAMWIESNMTIKKNEFQHELWVLRQITLFVHLILRFAVVWNVDFFFISKFYSLEFRKRK